MRPGQDADLVVGELEGGELGVELLERGPQRLVQGVDRAVALAHRDQPLALGV